MKMKKTDIAIVKEAEEQGLMVAMTGCTEKIRTELNVELSDYFRSQVSHYNGSFNEDEGEDVLDAINEYMIEKGIDKHPLGFPVISGTELDLIPLNENIQLKVITSDEYFGSGDYSKYVMVDFFMINSQTTKEDVDDLIDLVNNYMLSI